MTTTTSTTASLAPDRAERRLTSSHGLLRSASSLPEMRWAGAATLLFAIGGVLQLAGVPSVVWWGFHLTCYVCGGWEPALVGLRALREKTLDVDLLMIVAAIVAAAIGQVFDGALLIVIFATSGALEALATKRTEDSVAALLDLAPDRATRLVDEDAEEVVEAAALRVGDLILVRPGERIGADGLVTEGASDVDQASITGEPLPVARQVGGEVFAGSLNGSGALIVRVTRDPADSVVARIVALVEEASATKAKTQLFIERVEQRYSVGVVVSTLALFTVPLMLGAEFGSTLLRAMTFMIVASPCAVVLATMPPLLAVIANAGRHGVLVKSAVALEELGRTTLVAFDKTGTLTHGNPRVTTVVAFRDHTEGEVLRAAAAVERRSEHPVAAAIVSAAHGHDHHLPEVVDFRSTPGRGVAGTVDGVLVEVGSPALLNDLPHPDQAAVSQRLVALETQGYTVVVVTLDGNPAGLVTLADEVRATAAGAVSALASLTGVQPVLLTGDNQPAAERLALEVGISDVRAELLPQQKVEAIHDLRQNHQGGDGSPARVVLVGDGVNDAPAMAAADIGVAMGRYGSDLALETADVVLVRDDLAALPTTIIAARRAHRVVKANLVIAGTVITALVAWDILGTLPLPLGVAGHEGSTVVVALNGLRLLRRGAWRGN